MMRATRGAMQCMSRAAHRRRMAHCLELLKSRLRPPVESERHNPHAVHCCSFSCCACSVPAATRLSVYNIRTFLASHLAVTIILLRTLSSRAHSTRSLFYRLTLSSFMHRLQQLESPMSSKKKSTPSSAANSTSKNPESSGSRSCPYWCFIMRWLQLHAHFWGPCY